MRKILWVAAAIAACAASAASARDVYVQGHYNSNGTYVEPYHRSAPDSNPFNNYSTQGNVNPYTGQAGTVNPYNIQSQPRAPQPYFGAP